MISPLSEDGLLQTFAPSHKTSDSNLGLVALGGLWLAAAAVASGIAGGWLIGRLSSAGVFALWPAGFVAGYVGRLISGRPSKGLAWAALPLWLAALVIAEVVWLRWNTVKGEAGWIESVLLLPQFVQDFPMPALMGLLGAGFGAHSAWRQLRNERC
jgi:hypothetical protein